MSHALKNRLGRYVVASSGGEQVRAFVPPPLPPSPPLDLLPLLGRLADAERALGRLDGVSLLVPDASLFLYMYLRKEAVLSSEIEGTQSTLADLLRFEIDAAPGAPTEDVREVSNYVAALEYGLERLKDIPLSLRLIRELHKKLLAGARGAGKQPGDFRTSQNWIGGTRPGNAVYVPPPPSEVMPALDAFEKFMHDEKDQLPTLIKAGLLHVQFEAIHPFLDGNGRVGRLLITLFLCDRGVLGQPLLYLSLFLRRHREDYFRLLNEVRERGAWEAWLEFFLEGVRSTANDAFRKASEIETLFREDRARIAAKADAAGSALRLQELLQRNPFMTAPVAVERTKLTAPTINTAFEQLIRLGMVTEVTGRKRDRVYAYQRYLSVLNDEAGAS